MSETIEQCVKEKHLEYFEYSEFDKMEETVDILIDKVYRANWKQNEKPLALKSFNLDDITVKEIVNEV
jgi:hypothetical protein